MSLETRLTALAQAVGGDIKTLLANQGSLAALTTTAKTSLVASINELVTAISGLSGGGVTILDTAGTGDTTHAWSANKIVAELSQVKSDIINGAPTAYDTLVEIATQLSSDQTALSGLLTAVGNRVAYDAAQTLTTGQKAQACSNIGVGDPDHNFVTDYNTAKA
jgi:hypothetical protein